MNHILLKFLNLLRHGRWTSKELAPPPTNKFFKWVNHKCALAPILISEHESIAQSPLFTKFPPEIRLQIYEYALYNPDDEGYCVVTKEDGIPEPPLLFTCKTIRKEATEIFYHRNYFILKMTLWDSATDVLLMRKTKVWSDDFVDFRLDVDGNARWSNRDGEAHALPRQAVKRHEGDLVDMPGLCPMEWRFLESMFKVVAAMRERPWEETAEVIEGLRPGLYGLAFRWHPVHDTWYELLFMFMVVCLELTVACRIVSCSMSRPATASICDLPQCGI
jgi:hypothetical protein